MTENEIVVRGESFRGLFDLTRGEVFDLLSAIELHTERRSPALADKLRALLGPAGS